MNSLERKIDKLIDLQIDHPNNWETKEQVMSRFDVKGTTIDTWAKMYPQIMKYRKSLKETDTKERTIRRGNIYNVLLIHELVYSKPLKRAS
jgi:hypothetical protein